MDTQKDPLSKNTIYKISNNQNAIIDAFEAAASSFAVNHKIPGAKFYQPKLEEIPKPKKNQDQESFLQFDENSSDQDNFTAPQKDAQSFNIQEQLSKKKAKEQKQKQNQEIQMNENTKLPIPSNSVIYPPPMLDETDPDQIRLLHSWYWAGYYTGLADGKKQANSQ